MLKCNISVPCIIIIYFMLTLPGTGTTPLKRNSAHLQPEQDVKEETKIPLTFKNVIGNWSLKYSGNYGYHFSLSPSYRAIVIIYLNTQAFIFKGVYTIDEKNKLKINISEMKDEPRVTGINLYSGFVKAKSSYFLFSGYKIKINKKDSMYLEPRSIIIDGNNSEGYFEPVLKLTKNP
jgi:hypothetical protein